MLKRSPVVATVGLGANLGNPQAALAGAMASIAAVEGVKLVAQSAFYRSAPIDSSGPDYVNAVIQLHTTLSAPALLAQLQTIEQGAGRERPYRNAPRTLDLDLLLFGDAHIQSPALTVPHPRMWQRAFVLLPLAEIAPALVSAVQLDSVKDQILERVSDGNHG
jgi:2-amino-4-hydroxy-6-hydroxymethyldihydropteridine diphosphokinase